MADPVTKPSYYQLDGLEVKDVIWAAGHGEAFFLGAAIKYLLRAGRKDSKRQDLAKAVECIQEVIRHLPAEVPKAEVGSGFDHRRKVAEAAMADEWSYLLPVSCSPDSPDDGRFTFTSHADDWDPMP